MPPVLRSPVALVGLAVLVLGCGPLALVVAGELLGLARGAEPSGIGPLAVLAFPAGALLLAVGTDRAPVSVEADDPPRSLRR